MIIIMNNNIQAIFFSKNNIGTLNNKLIEPNKDEDSESDEEK
jgi:hypothetical protein